MVGMVEAQGWAAELESVFPRVAGRFGRAHLRWRMRDYLRGLLAPVARKNGWQLAEYVGHRTPDGFQRLLNSSVWDAETLRDDVRDYVAGKLGPGGVLIIDDTGFTKKGSTSAGVGRQYTGTSGKIDNWLSRSWRPARTLRESELSELAASNAAVRGLLDNAFREPAPQLGDPRRARRRLKQHGGTVWETNGQRMISPGALMSWQPDSRIRTATSTTLQKSKKSSQPPGGES